jgi:hypothetical protein
MMFDAIESLSHIEEIKQLKARYIRLGDTKDWNALSEILAEDFEAVFDVAPRFSKDQPNSVAISGRDTFIQAWAPALVNVVTVHQVFMPEITLTGTATATGIWGLHTFAQMPNCIFQGWSHYHDEYLREGGVWKIRRSETRCLRSEETWS